MDSANSLLHPHNNLFVERPLLHSITLNEGVVDPVSPPPRDDVPPSETRSTPTSLECINHSNFPGPLSSSTSLSEDSFAAKRRRLQECHSVHSGPFFLGPVSNSVVPDWGVSGNFELDSVVPDRGVSGNLLQSNFSLLSGNRDRTSGCAPSGTTSPNPELTRLFYPPDAL